jgi:hypothetical protein
LGVGAGAGDIRLHTVDASPVPAPQNGPTPIIADGRAPKRCARIGRMRGRALRAGARSKRRLGWNQVH